MTAGVLTVRLVARQVAWHPDGARGCGLRVNAFAEEGKPARIPGPLIRVPVGTEVRIVLRNALDDAVRIRGLLERPVGWLALTAGQAQVAMGGTPPDRIFVLTHTRVAGAPSVEDPARAREVNAINGLSWPHSERLSASVGDTLRWRVLNPAATSHTMHLHGFYFRILARGSVSAYDSAFPPSRQETVVSEFMPPNRTMTMEWVPERPGNWLFHCHFLIHMSPAQRVDRVFGSATVARNVRHDNHGVDAMAGPIVGITVRAHRGRAAPVSVPSRRVLRLFANERPRVFGELPGMGFVLQSGDTPPATDSFASPEVR